jgi:hypothetical protein
MANDVAIIAARWRTPWSGTCPIDYARSSIHTPLVATSPIGTQTLHRAARLVDDMAKFAIACGEEIAAVHDIQPSDRLGLFVGAGGLRASSHDLWQAMQQQQADATGAWQRGLGRMHPLWMLKFLSNNVHAIISSSIGARGEGAVFAGPLGGSEALMSAQAAINDDAVDHAIVVCYDSRSAQTAPEIELERRRQHDKRIGVDCAVALLLVSPRAVDESRAQLRFSITTQCRTDSSEQSMDSNTIDSGTVAPAVQLGLEFILKTQTRHEYQFGSHLSSVVTTYA